MNEYSAITITYIWLFRKLIETIIIPQQQQQQQQKQEPAMDGGFFSPVTAGCICLLPIYLCLE
ncbi:hypothetical protein DERF_006026 [Dermatophagoides farinae]|uniref:Uncharacterized protein n=1 Tax=Dermatophagoides farinae TaxID=6954 RepID=A0A922I4N9_DERFA|nr:hypothetical protein DERF_006026 [Dermatophagoides farinae]